MYITMKSRHYSIAVVFALLLTSIASLADEVFNSEESFKSPVSVPAPIVAHLTKALGSEKTSTCQVSRPHDMFEAQLIDLNKSTKAFLVKPARMCLCEANNCPMWVFKAKGSPSKPLWSSPSTKTFTLLDKTLNGYKKLREVSADATNDRESIWSWNKDSYVEIYKHVWIWDTEKRCRSGEETTQLMDGQMVERTRQCTQE
ncbi:hypothetical protein SAMN05192566_0805 [Methylophilus rhizosphaerae]|uniref:Uncharacterized protein n=2 Tax=Methylophilus rhizosphaerae TaxID=492660 RepID=A0A1G9ATG5_9PROT|nr:hypothetical protein SAMN05192566_0805 [Methylophilus rhizosphaerae]